MRRGNRDVNRVERRLRRHGCSLQKRAGERLGRRRDRKYGKALDRSETARRSDGVATNYLLKNRISSPSLETSSSNRCRSDHQSVVTC